MGQPNVGIWVKNASAPTDLRQSLPCFRLSLPIRCTLGTGFQKRSGVDCFEELGQVFRGKHDFFLRVAWSVSNATV